LINNKTFQELLNQIEANVKSLLELESRLKRDDIISQDTVKLPVVRGRGVGDDSLQFRSKRCIRNPDQKL